MAFLRHILIAAAYSATAAAVAVTLSLQFPALGIALSMAIGGLALLGSALLHEVFTRQDDHARIAEELHDLRLSHGEVMRELTNARAAVAALHERVVQAVTRDQPGASAGDLDSLQAEVRVLQSLIHTLNQPPAAPAVAPAPVLSAGPAPILSREAARAAQPTTMRFEPAPTPPATEETVPQPSVPEVLGRLSDADILAIVRDGLRHDRVDLVLQPIVSLPQRQRVFYEAFTRIRSADGVIIVPEQYIAIAEREGLIAAIDNMLLFRCVQLVRKTRRMSRDVGFFCNISTYTLTDKVFFRDFTDFMADNTELAPYLIFEIAQAAMADGDPELDRHLSRLAAMGFRFSIDQVGSLSFDFDRLLRRRVKFVKIDAHALVHETSTPGKLLAIGEFRRALERHAIDLIAEKVESEATLRELLDLPIRFGQGYLFGEPRLSRAA